MGENELIKRNKKKINKLSKLFSCYAFNDVCKSIYCINSYLPNRSHFEMSIVLNEALIKANKDGSLLINDYESFIDFTKKIHKIIKPSFMDDPVVTDNGEFKISFEGKFYSVYLGNSFSMSFSVYMSMDAVSHTYHFEDKLMAALIFIDDEIKRYNYNSLVEDYDFSKFYFPNREYFNEVLEKYTNTKICPTLLNYSLEYADDIYKTHFINIEDKSYRIFNTSLVIDVFYSLLKDKVEDAGNISFYDSLFSNYIYYGEANNCFIDVGIVDNLDNHKIFGEYLFKGAIISKTTLVLFSNIYDWKEKEFDEYFKIIKERISKKALLLVEISTKKARVIDLRFIENFMIVSYIPNISINDNPIFTDEEKNEISVLDLISLFYQSKSIGDLVEFLILYFDSIMDPILSMFSGAISKYDYWINNGKLISRGAIEYNLISQDVYENEYSLLDIYKELNIWYPFVNPTNDFLNPFRWIRTSADNKYIEIYDKAIESGFGGEIRLVNDHYLFFTYNIKLYNKKDIFSYQLIKIIQDLNTVYFGILEDSLIDSGLFKYNVNILHLPLDYAREVDHNGFTSKNTNYVYSDSMINKNVLLIRFAVNFDVFCDDMMNSKDNSVELIYISELLSCLVKYHFVDYREIQKKISSLAGKKQIKLSQKKLEHYISEKPLDISIKDTTVSKINKFFATECKKVNIDPGTYERINFRENIRKLQNNVIPIFEKEIYKFDRIQLHKILLSLLASKTFNSELNKNKMHITHSNELNNQAKQKSEQIILDDELEQANYIRIINYLIDTNLSILRDSSLQPTFNDIEYLLSFSDRLIVFQDTSDSANYDLLPIKLVIDNDYIPDVFYQDGSNDVVKEREQRKIHIRPYLPSLDTKIIDTKQIDESFKKDTGVSLINILSVCKYLEHEFSYTFKDEVYPNVFEINYFELIDDIKKVFPSMNDKDLEDSLEYLFINSNRIKEIDGKNQKFIPIWEREKRSHRNETRPLVKNDNNIIFSPILIYDFNQKWKTGIHSFYLQYESGLNNTLNLLSNWKRECEKQMEEDVKNLFHTGDASKDVKLHKLDKDGNHPLELGDYDVLAVDRKNKILYNIETKYLTITGSIRENYNFQDTFFNKDKKDERFQRRIDYLSSNYHIVLNKLFSISDYSDYRIVNYMVTNKLLYCDVKKIKFNIITYSELEDIIKK